MKNYELTKYLNMKFYANNQNQEEWINYSNEFINEILNILTETKQINDIVNNEMRDMMGKVVTKEDSEKNKSTLQVCRALIERLDKLETLYLSKYQPVALNIEQYIQDKQNRIEFLSETAAVEHLKGLETRLNYYEEVLNRFANLNNQKSNYNRQPQL